MKKQAEKMYMWEFYESPQACPGTEVAFRSLHKARKAPSKKSKAERERKLKLLKIQIDEKKS